MSRNTVLETLFCNNTQIKALDLSANRSLKEIRLPHSLEQPVTLEGYRITLTQTQQGKIELSADIDDETWEFMYHLNAIPQPGYEFVRWKHPDFNRYA